MSKKREKVFAIYWYDAREYDSDKGEVTDLSRMPHIRTIGVLREYKDGRHVILNIESEKHMNDLGELKNDNAEGTTILKHWIHKKVFIGEI